jgi:tyrosyl-tRNA synthetase
MKGLSAELQQRGFIHQHTGESLTTVLDTTPRTIYLGVDPTADSAHVGHLAIWILLKHLNAAGHTVIFLAGGGTGRIGDPKPDAERELQEESVIDANVAAISAQAQALIATNDNTVVFANNAEWLTELKLIDFLRDIGKHFTVNDLIKKDAIASRLQTDTGLSYTEFAYPLLQGYDYLELHKRYGCDVQVGGSDQWGNIVAGVDLVRRKAQAEVHAVTVPLVIDKATGKKFGKSEGNAVWLDAQKTSPYAFYQFWLNVSDESVIDYLKLYTFISLDEIAALEKAHAADPGARMAQRTLAESVTTFVHGAEAASHVVRVSEVLFGGRSIKELSEAEIDLLAANAPMTAVVSGSLLVDALVQAALASSKREARTFIESGAVYMNGDRVESTETLLTIDTYGSHVLLRRGKKQYSVLVLQ